jgi:DNA-binding XRE family transcriptional regulator
MSEEANTGGRPLIVFDEEQVIEVKALSAFLTKAQMADYFGISERTLLNIEKRQPEVFAAYKKGKVDQLIRVAGNLVSQSDAGNTSATIFYLKTQGGWKEQQAEIVDIPPINVTTQIVADDSTK